MKKIASLLMALLLAAATFTACNNNGNETSNGDNSVASQPSSVSTAGESAVTSTEPDEPYTNGNGIYVTDFDKTKYEGKTITLPERFLPSKEMIEYHNSKLTDFCRYEINRGSSSPCMAGR